MRDVVDVLREDHARLRYLLRQLRIAQDPERRTDLVGRITDEVRQHIRGAEAHFHPSYRAVVASEEAHVLYHESLDGHRLIDEVLDGFEGLDPASPEHVAKARLLTDLLAHHVLQEERVMFRQARRALPRHDLRVLGERILDDRRRAVVVGGT